MRASIPAWLVASALAVCSLASAAEPAAVKEKPPALGWDFNGVWLTPVIAPAYTPELELFVSAGGMVSWKNDPRSPRSSFPASIGYSTTGAVVYSGFLKSYWFADRLRLDLDSWYKDMPDDYFGVGYDEGKNTPLGDDTTAYHRNWWQLKMTVLNRIFGSLFLGLMLDGNHTVASDMNPKMAADPHVVADGPDNLNFGAGPAIRYDSRDFPQNAYSGTFLQLTYLTYVSYFGNHLGYRILDIDYRHYITVPRRGSTLTWTLRWRRGLGEVPWAELSVLGSSTDLRGYRAGRYREQTVGYAIVEHRYMFSKGENPDGSVKLSRHGVVGWVGAGVLGEGLIVPDGWLPNAGVGYRFEVQERLNARFDFGVGRESQGVYFAFTESY
ncbi:MAG TPA: BamA/TamA family outer membrane protein [Polyangiaceae bacterium]|nr:BamA/TamA family outer membrane protein [Polyangiaceae bacterium]